MRTDNFFIFNTQLKRNDLLIFTQLPNAKLCTMLYYIALDLGMFRSVVKYADCIISSRARTTERLFW